MGTRSFLGVKSGRGVMLTPRPRLVPWSWKSRTIPLLPLWAVRPVQSLSACTRVHFTFTLYKETLRSSHLRMTVYKTCTMFPSTVAVFISKCSSSYIRFTLVGGCLAGWVEDWETGGLRDWGTEGLGAGGLILRFLTLVLFYGIAISFILPHILEKTVRKYVTFIRQIFRF